MFNSPIAQWALFVIAAGLIGCLAKPALKWWRQRPWKIRSLPLRGATVILDSVTPMPSPPRSEEAGDDTQLRNYYCVNATIVPLERSSKIPWTPLHLRVVPAERWRPEHPASTELDRYCRVESIDLVCGTISFPPDEQFTVAGKFDVRLELAVRHDIRVLQFRYYLEEFGVFQLPSPASAVLASKDLMAVAQPVTAG